MKGGHIELITGILVGTVVGGLYGTHLAMYLPVLVGVLGLVFLVKFLGLK